MKPQQEGTVYVVQAGRYVKIGWTSDLNERLRALRTGSPHQLTVLGTRAGTMALERAWHKEFARYRSQGEWFLLGTEQMSTLRARLEGEPRIIQLPKAVDKRHSQTAQLHRAHHRYRRRKKKPAL